MIHHLTHKRKVSKPLLSLLVNLKITLGISRTLKENRSPRGPRPHRKRSLVSFVFSVGSLVRPKVTKQMDTVDVPNLIQRTFPTTR